MIKVGDVADTLQRALAASGCAAARIANKRRPLQSLKAVIVAACQRSVKRHGTLRIRPPSRPEVRQLPFGFEFVG
jgi:hypothetical protein